MPSGALHERHLRKQEGGRSVSPLREINDLKTKHMSRTLDRRSDKPTLRACLMMLAEKSTVVTKSESIRDSRSFCESCSEVSEEPFVNRAWEVGRWAR